MTETASAILAALEDTIVEDIGRSDETISHEEKTSLIRSLEEQVKPLRRSRGIIKRKITLLLKPFLEESHKESSSSLLDTVLEEVNLRLSEVRQYDNDIEAQICGSALMKHDTTFLNEEIAKSSHYHLQIQKIVHETRPADNVSTLKSSASSQEGDSVSRKELHSILKNFKPQQEIKIPALKCQNFSGAEDKHAFRSFLLSFENVYGCRKDISDAAKLQYLKSHLQNYALKDIQHLTNVNENYAVAIKILKEVYLDVPFLVDTILHKIDSSPVLDNKNLEETRFFVSEVRAHLHELKEFDLDFLKEGTAGNKLISHLVVDKLPPIFLRELKLKTQIEYPSINLILSDYMNILKSLERTGNRTAGGSKEKHKSASSQQKSSYKERRTSSFNTAASMKSHKETKTSNTKESTSPSTSSGGGFSSASSTAAECKLCNGKHSMTGCDVYTTASSRRERCIELGMCANCSSKKHVSAKCPAKRFGLSRPCGICKSGAHITALCSSKAKSKVKNDHQVPNPSSSQSSSEPQEFVEDENVSSNHLCINTGNTSSAQILPTISLKIKRGEKIVTARAILDLGSQITFFNGCILNKLGLEINSLPVHESKIKTFLGEQVRSFHTVDLEMNICCSNFVKKSIFIDPELDVGFEVKGLMGAINNVSYSGYHVADRFYVGRHGSSVSSVDGLLGIDVISHMKHFKIVDCLKGKAIETCHGFVPFGPAKSFLTPSQRLAIYGREQNFETPPQERF